MNIILVWILIPLSLVCSWALWRCTQERDACRGELFIAHQRPSVWLRAEDFEAHGFTPSPTPMPSIANSNYEPGCDLSALSPDKLHLCLGVNSTSGDYAALQVDEKNYVYAKCASPEAVADMERKQIAVFNCKCEGDER